MPPVVAVLVALAGASGVLVLGLLAAAGG